MYSFSFILPAHAVGFLLLLMDNVVAMYVGPQGFGRDTTAITSTTSSSSSTSPKTLEAEWLKPPISPKNDERKVSTPMLPRSGHVSFTVGKDLYIFGGYAEETNGDGDENNLVSRYPTNDLWKRSADVDATSVSSWELVEQKGNCPEERLVSAVSVLNGRPYLFGGWNPNNREQGNEILDTVHSLDLQSNEWRQLPTSFPDGPTSRHVALTLPCKSKALLHNHRCTDFVYVFDANTEKFRKQNTTGVAPSSRGLHAACMLGSFGLFFGGADKTGSITNDVFLLNTFTWEWTPVKIKLDANDPNPEMAMPSVRAAPSMVSYNETCAVLYGGAKASESGLEPLDDEWALFVNRFSGEGRWDLISPVSSTSLKISKDKGGSVMPPGRNAATLSEITVPAPTKKGDTTCSTFNRIAAPQTKYFLLHGGWAPFRQTFMDDFILRVSVGSRE